MALSNAGVIEVRTTGSDSNGGGFKTGATGTDFSQQTAAQFALTAVTTSASNAILLSASAATTMVGNYANIVSGTNFTAGIYEIISVVAGVSITLDRTCTTAAGSAGVVNIGGCFATIGKALGIMTVTGMQCYVKATATYSISTGLSTPSGNSAALGICRVIGYTTTRGDGLQPTIQTTAAITAYTDANGFRFENFIINCNAVGTNGILFSGSYCAAFNCIIKGALNYGVNLSGNGTGIYQCQVTTCGGASNNAAVVCGLAGGTGFRIRNCYINANTTVGISIIGVYAAVTGNIIASNTGASSDGILFSTAYSNVAALITNNVFYANGRDGVRSTGNYEVSEISNNIFVSNVGIGLNTSAMNPVVNDVLIHHNAFYNNGTARSGNNAGTGDVTLTGVPFTNAGTGDFSLNNTASQGAALRSVGYPGTLIGGGTGFEDIGALRHQDPSGGSGGVLVNPQR